MNNTAMGTYQKEYDDLKKLQSSLNRDVQKRNEMKANGKPIGSIDAEIRGQLKSFTVDLIRVQELVKQQEKNQQNLGITARELEARRKQLAELEQSRKTIHALFFSTVATNNNKKVERFEEKYDIEGQSKNQIMKFHADEHQQQEKVIDSMLSAVGRIKHGGTQINEELHSQNELLNDLDYGLDKNTQILQSASQKMKKLLQTRSNFCLMSCVCIEIFFLLFFLIFL